MQRKEQDSEMNNVIDLSVAKGLLIGGKGGDENWLKALPPGTVFLSKRKGAHSKELQALELWCILEHKEICTNLVQKVPTGQQVDLWFRSLDFSRLNDLIEVIASVEFGYDQPTDKQQEETTTETTDGSSDRPV